MDFKHQLLRGMASYMGTFTRIPEFILCKFKMAYSFLASRISECYVTVYKGFHGRSMDTFTRISECIIYKFKWVFLFGASRILNVM